MYNNNNNNINTYVIYIDDILYCRIKLFGCNIMAPWSEEYRISDEDPPIAT